MDFLGAEQFLDQHNGAISAFSAVFIAIFTVVLAWKTSGLYEATRGLQTFAKIQSEDMKSSIDQARRAATAMEIAAQSSEGSLEVAKSSLRDTERAFVYLKKFNMQLDRPLQPATYGGQVLGPVHSLSLAPIWANSGKTPARRLLCNFGIEFRAGDKADKYDFFDKGPPIRAVLGPSAELFTPPQSIDSDAFGKLQRREQSMFIWGWADYDDIFAGTSRHRTEFCCRVEVVADAGGQILVTFPVYSNFNAFDEECSRPPSQP